MKHLLNTLFVTTQGAYLCRQGETVLVRVEADTKLQVPIHTLGGIVCFGQVILSPPLMAFCAEHGVLISFLSEYGKFWARVQGKTSGNVLLRREQYRKADDQNVSSKIASSIITAKIANSRTVLKRALRDYPESQDLRKINEATDKLTYLIKTINQDMALGVLRGIEGDAARTYFSVFDNLIVSQKNHFFFKERTRRPPLDNMNALLSFCYTLLVHDVTSALEGVGLDSAVGFLHRDRPGRAGLALDLIEEFRPIFADRLALSLVNRQQVKNKGFKQSETGAVTMNDETRKELLVAYQKRKQDEIRHPFLDETVKVGLLPHVQALLFARYLRGDIDGYPPFIWK